MNQHLQDIMQIAENNDNIRALILYGSRVDPDVIPDQFQDYDLYCIVKNVPSFNISIFGSPILSFVPSENYPLLFPDKYSHLMLFGNDSRIDLTVCTLETFLSDWDKGQLMRCILDKDGTIPALNETDKSAYWITPMDKKSFEATCSEFFWEVQNMVKGLKRAELSYSMFIRDISLRDMLNRLIDQYIGINNEFRVSVGTLGKYRRKYLSAMEYDLYEKTYLSNTAEDRWNSLGYMMDLFSYLGKKIASNRGYVYPDNSEAIVRAYIHRIYQMEI